jgi:PDZ domain-containing protein
MGRRESRIPGLQLLLILLPVLVLGMIVPAGLYSETPGGALAVQHRVSIPEATTYKHEGDLMLTTVSVSPHTTLTALLRAARNLNGGGELVKAVDILGPSLDPEANDREGAALMQQSKDNAVAVALKQLGYPVQVTEKGAKVLAVQAGWPAEGKLQVGDVISGVNGESVANTGDLTRLVGGAGIGREVTLQGQRNGRPLEVTITTREAEQRPGQGAVGIIIQDDVELIVPIQVNIETGNIGGPSAGLMMALSVIDVLSSDGLTGGKRVAGTGEIDPDGSVGPIGGINLKIRAAQVAGAVAFILPVDNLPEVVVEDVHIALYPVADINEALQALEQIRASE